MNYSRVYRVGRAAATAKDSGNDNAHMTTSKARRGYRGRTGQGKPQGRCTGGADALAAAPAASSLLYLTREDARRIGPAGHAHYHVLPWDTVKLAQANAVGAVRGAAEGRPGHVPHVGSGVSFLAAGPEQEARLFEPLLPRLRPFGRGGRTLPKVLPEGNSLLGLLRLLGLLFLKGLQRQVRKWRRARLRG